MLSRSLITIAAALALAISLPTLADSFNVKPGAWQMSMSTLLVGNPLAPEALASMPPEKRARVEEAMKARAGKPVTISHKACVSREDLDQDRIIRSDRNDSQGTRRWQGQGRRRCERLLARPGLRRNQ